MHAGRPMVSFTMSAWNPRPDWLRLAVMTVLRQQGCRVELVIVDNGSTVPIASVLADCDDPRVRVLRVPHGRAAFARNFAFAESRGEVIRPIDADDAFPVSSTEDMLRLMGPGYERIAYGAVLHCDAELRPRWRMTCDLSGRVVEDCLLGRLQVRQHSMLFPRGVAEAAGDVDPALEICYDWDWILRAAEVAEVVGHRGVATYYRRHPTSETRRYELGVAEADQVVRKHFERHPELRGSELERRAKSRLPALAARVWLTHGHYGRASKAIAHAAISDPRSLVEETRRSAPAMRGWLGYTVRRRTDFASRRKTLPTERSVPNARQFFVESSATATAAQ